MFELVCDRRFGKRPVLLIPSSNSLQRLKPLFAYYRDFYDLVLIDQVSTDGSLAAAEEVGASVWRVRTNGSWSHILAAFLRDLADPSVFHILLRPDEFVAMDMLSPAVSACIADSRMLISRKTPWYYGRRLAPISRYSFRGALPSGITEAILDDALPPQRMCEVVDVDHLQVNSVSRNFGTCGVYCAIEVSNFAAENRLYKGFAKRYIVQEILRFSTFMRNGWIGYSGLIGGFLISLAGALIATVALLEHVFLPDEKEQLAIFERFMRKHEHH